MQYARFGQEVAALQHRGLWLVGQDPADVDLGGPTPLHHHPQIPVSSAAVIGEGAPQHLHQIGLPGPREAGHVAAVQLGHGQQRQRPGAVKLLVGTGRSAWASRARSSL